MWSDADDAVIGGDLTAGLAYLTPAGGAVVTAVAPIGLRDREAGTVGFTTSLGFGRKLDRIRSDPRVALAYHAREHGFATEPRFVLVQGTASYDAHPDRRFLEDHIQPASTRFLGPPRRGLFWDRWLQAYYSDRVLVTVAVERVISWPDLACTGQPSVTGQPPPAQPAGEQTPPAKGTGPRLDVGPAARRLRRLPHVLLSYRGADGFSFVAPVTVGGDSDSGGSGSADPCHRAPGAPASSATATSRSSSDSRRASTPAGLRTLFTPRTRKPAFAPRPTRRSFSSSTATWPGAASSRRGPRAAASPKSWLRPVPAAGTSRPRLSTGPR